MGKCPWCHGRGYELVEPGLSSLSYKCPDCNGTGYIPECEICGHEYYGEFCEECYDRCEECGKVFPFTELDENGLCEECRPEPEEEETEK